MHHLGLTARMGPRLQAVVERQLLDDLAHYGVSRAGLSIDWSRTCGEGHCTRHLDGNLEELSGVRAFAPGDELVAEGWMDFVHGGDHFPLFVFWLFLSVAVNGEMARVKGDVAIPAHLWERLPKPSKDACFTEGRYDARWARDPKVREAKRQPSQTEGASCPVTASRRRRPSPPPRATAAG
jgi:hypothetical protein